MSRRLSSIIILILAVALVAAVVARPQSQSAPAARAGVNHSAHERKILHWVDPMHPAYTAPGPGVAPDCGMQLVPVYEDEISVAAPATSSVAGRATVKLSESRRQLIGVQTARAGAREMGRNVRTVGRIAIDERRLHTVVAKFDGYVEKLYANTTGAVVRRGEPLLSAYSPDLLATQQEYLIALRAARQSPSLADAARRRLLLWDVTPAEVRALERSGVARKSTTIVSPVSGTVMTRLAVEGSRVTAGMPLFEIAALDRVWIQADVYESELSAVRLGAAATMTLSYLPGRSWQGRVSFIAPSVDPLTRTVRVRIEADNRDAALKPEMFADVVIRQQPRRAIAVPDSAVLQTGTRSIVFVVKPNGDFEPREIALGVRDGEFREVVRGVEEGETVVTQANFLVDSESQLKAALGRMSATPAEHVH
jgi:Cu(I)/Ag(I) efflux system membrane fusion protein